MIVPDIQAQLLNTLPLLFFATIGIVVMLLIMPGIVAMIAPTCSVPAPPAFRVSTSEMTRLVSFSQRAVLAIRYEVDGIPGEIIGQLGKDGQVRLQPTGPMSAGWTQQSSR